MDQMVTEIVHAAPFMMITMLLTSMIWARELERNDKEWCDICTKLDKSWAEICKALADRLREAGSSRNVT